MDEPRIYYAEWSKSERERQIPYINTHTHIYIWNLERWYWWSYLQASKGETGIKNRFWTLWEKVRMEWFERIVLKHVYSVQFSCSVVSNSLWPHESQHARPPCLSPTPGVYPNSCSLSRWCHPAISSSVVPFSSCPQSLPASVFSNESALCIRWPKYWSFSFNISPSNEYSGLISFRMDWLDLLAAQGTLKSLLQYHSSKAPCSVLSFLNSPTLTWPLEKP